MTGASFPSLGDHEVVRFIARGAMGSVFEVRHRTSGVHYAAKTIQKALDANQRRRFRREADLLTRCADHPGIVKIHLLGETTDGLLYLILDLVRGESLEALLERETRLAPRRAAQVVRDVASALGFIHAQGVVHRDVKPSNILLDENGEPRLTDFGVATAHELERLTRTGGFVGTLLYCSPEQARATGEVGARSDVFSLGCVLYRALAGRLAVESDSALGLYTELDSPDPVADVRTHAPDVPASLAAIVARAIAKAPGDRFACGRELAHALDRYLEGSEVRFARPERTRKVLRGLALAVGLLVVPLGAVFLGRAWSRRSEALAAVADARGEVEHASAILARGPTPGDSELASVRDCLARARARLATARSFGVSPDDPAADPERLAPDLAFASATALLARGAAGEALAALDTVAGAPATLTPPGRLARARALLSLGRPAEAAVDARAGAATAPLAAAELEGEARLAQGDAAGAQTCFTRALELEASPALRALRGAAAAVAGDDRVASADLEALVPDLANATGERLARAGLTPIIAAIYRRGLVAKDEARRDADLELAWRLGPPPRALVPALEDVWCRRAGAECAAWAIEAIDRFGARDTFTQRLRTILARPGRLRAVDPGFRLDRIPGLIESLREIFSPQVDPPGVDPVGIQLASEWPEEPVILFVISRSLAGTRGARRKSGLTYVVRAIDLVPAAVPGEAPGWRLLAHDLGRELIDATRGRGNEEQGAIERVERMAQRANFAQLWAMLGSAHHQAERHERAVACFDRAEAVPSAPGTVWDGASVTADRVDSLGKVGRLDEALALARTFHATQPPAIGLPPLVAVLVLFERWDEVQTLVVPDQVHDPGTLHRLGVALSALGRREEARKLIPRVEALSSSWGHLLAHRILVDEVRTRIATLSRQGRLVEALDLVRGLREYQSDRAMITLEANVLNQLGRHEELIAKTAGVSPSGLLIERGIALAKTGRIDEARAALAALDASEFRFRAAPLRKVLEGARATNPR